MTTSRHDLDDRLRSTFPHDDLTTDAEVGRLWTSVLDRLEDEPPVATPSIPAARSARRRPLRLGAALAGAAAVALTIALSPFDSGDSPSVVPSPTSAQAALLRAADAAGAADWTPLGAGEYHHTMSISFQPHVPRQVDPDAARNPTMEGIANSTEMYLDRDGRGTQIRVSGGNGDPNSFLTPFPADRIGRIMAFSIPDGAHDPQGSVEDQLRYAYQVSVMAWPRHATPTYRIWFRTPRGFQTGAPNPGGAVAQEGLSLGQRFQRDVWGAPLTVIDRLNNAPADQLEAELDKALAPTPDSEIAVVGPLAQGEYDTTQGWFTAQIQVQNAVKLLARAPLAPHVRSALFERLARQDHVTLRRGQKDEQGRTGTRITFEWKLNERVPAFSITKEQLRADAVDKQQPADGPITGPAKVRVPAHMSVGHWYQSIIIDESTGTILQDESYSRWKTTIAVPRVAMTSPRRPIGSGWNLTIKHEPGLYGSGSGDVFVANDRATSLAKPLTTACATTPRMCR